MKHDNFKKPPIKSSVNFQLPSIESRIDYNSLTLVFSFRHMKYGSKNCLSMCDKKNKVSIINTILKLSQQKWGTIKLEQIPHKQFKIPLPKIITPDVPILVFRFSKSGRIAGFREHDIYHIIQVNPNHKLY